MKITLILASLSLLTLAPIARAQYATTGTTVMMAQFSNDVINAGYALTNITDAALDLAEQYARASGIQGTYAGSYLNDLIRDTDATKHSAQRLTALLDANASDNDIRAELATLDAKFQTIYRNSAKAATQLSSQGKTTEGYQLRSAYTKVRSRYVYLQGRLNN